jgi:hypothetical protein
MRDGISASRACQDDRDAGAHQFAVRLDRLVESRPEAIALRFCHQEGWQIWRWRDLQARILSASRGLQDLGFSASDVLWVDGDLSPHLLVVVLAAWSIGGGVRPLDGRRDDHRADDDASMRDGCRYVFLQGRRAVVSSQSLLRALIDGQGAGLTGAHGTSRGMTLICDRLGLGFRAAEANDGQPRLLSYADLLGDSARFVPSAQRPPADLYWVEASGNDLANIAALMDFWLDRRVALTFPAGRTIREDMSFQRSRMTAGKSGGVTAAIGAVT